MCYNSHSAGNKIATLFLLEIIFSLNFKVTFRQFMLQYNRNVLCLVF